MAFELQPTLTGDLLTLRPLKVDDFEMLFAVACDPLIWEQHPNHDRWKRDVFENFFRGAMEYVRLINSRPEFASYPRSARLKDFETAFKMPPSEMETAFANAATKMIDR